MTRVIGMVAALALAAGVMAGDEETSGKSDALHPRLKMETSLGDIILELDAEKAPISTTNFIQYGEDKFYDGTIFHRVIKTFMIQGGGFTSEMEEKSEGLRPPIKNEWQNGLNNVRGTIAMARTTEPDSATSQFFINVVDNAALDRPRFGAAYAVFGKVVEGMETVDKIRDVEVSGHPKYGGGSQPTVPVEPVVIKSVRLAPGFTRADIEAAVAKVKEAAKAAEAKVAAERKRRMLEYVRGIEAETGAKAVTTDSGLVYIDLKAGDGPVPQKTDKVEVHYTGWLMGGDKFDSSVDRDQPFAFNMSGGVIEGWLEGVLTMKVGGKRKLIIPPELGYGKQGRGAQIPPDSVLVFDVELLGIK